ncbi:MAG: hypothetical protein GX907_02330 [Clostridiaceae bacterium]|nr:hypothetical protein [Clostridiaceae bacterium]
MTASSTVSGESTYSAVRTPAARGNLPRAIVGLITAIATLAGALVFARRLLGSDLQNFLIWWLTLSGVGLCAWPISMRLFSTDYQAAWLLAKPLGLALGSFSTWFMAYIRIIPLSALNFGLILLLIFLLPLFTPKGRHTLFRLKELNLSKTAGLIFVEALFLFCLLAMAFSRGLRPHIADLEKYMDYGFMLSILRSDSLPAKDIWLAGHSINYYYFGQFVFAQLTRLSGITPRVTYNLSLAAVFAYGFTSVYSIFRLLLTLPRRSRRSLRTPVALDDVNAYRRERATAAGQTAGSAQTTAAGQTAGSAQTAAAGQSAKPGRRSTAPATLTEVLTPDPRLNCVTRSLPLGKAVWVTLISLFGAAFLNFAGNSQAWFFAADFGWGKQLLERWIARGYLTRPDPWFYSDSTRFIGYFPDNADKTISEFPMYSYLVADLHAHLINMIFVLLMIAVLIMLCYRGTAVFLARREAARISRPPQPRTVPEETTGVRKFFARLSALLLPNADAPLPGTDLLRSPLFWLISVLFSIFMSGNFWDFAIYMAVITLLLFALNWQIFNRAGHPFNRNKGEVVWSFLLLVCQLLAVIVPFMIINHPAVLVVVLIAIWFLNQLIINRVTDPMILTGLEVTHVFTLAHILTLPFNTGFEPIAKSIARTVTSSPFWQLFVMWGPTTIVALSAFVIVVALIFRQKRQRRALSAELAALPTAENMRPRTKIWRTVQLRLRLDEAHLSTAKLVCLVFFVAALGLILLPEIVYVVDIYSGDYKRANTMFKFTYQAFILLGIAAVAALELLIRTVYDSIRWRSERRRNQKLAFAGVPTLSEESERKSLRSLRRPLIARTWGGIVALILTLALAVFFIIPPCLYPTKAIPQAMGNYKIENYEGLDGVRQLATRRSYSLPGSPEGGLAADLAAIEWFNAEIEGQPIILEAWGESYTDYCRISAYTGLPTVLGWQTHEWLWRTSRATPNAWASVVCPLQQEIRAFYEATDPDTALSQLRGWNVKYLIVGALERNQFPDLDEDLLRSLGEIVFEAGDLYVLEIPAAEADSTK